MDYGLSDRVALVTGGSQGIGAAVARQLAREGASVVLTYHSGQERAAALVADIDAAGGTAIAVPMELSSLDSVRAAVSAAVDRFGHLDVLVNNAVNWGDRAPLERRRFEDQPAPAWQPEFRENFEGAYAATQAAAPGMRERGWGRIVNISSGLAIDGLPGTAPYASAKAALHGLTATLAKELGPAGILVNVVMPGPTLTTRFAARPEEVLVRYEARTAIGRLLPPEEVAPTIVFLCSAANTAVTGELIRASGGHRS